MFVGVYGIDKAESQKHLSRGNQLLNAGQLAEALTHYHAAVGKLELLLFQLILVKLDHNRSSVGVCAIFL